MFHIIQELGIKYTLDDRLDAIATDNGANFLAAVEDLLENGMCEEQVQCACHAYPPIVILIHQGLTIPTNATRELIEIFQKNKIHCSTLLTEVLSLVNQMVEIEQDDDACGEHLVNEIEIAPVADAKVSSFHATPHDHTLKLIKDVVTRWNSTCISCSPLS